MPSNRAITYFEFPWGRGDVFAVDVPRETFAIPHIVNLFANVKVTLEVQPGFLPIAHAISSLDLPDIQGVVYNARLVFRGEQARRYFSGSWDDLIESLNAAAAVNTLFTVVLPNVEHARLAAGDLAHLKQRLNEDTAAKLELISATESTNEPGRPCLEIYRFCSGCS